MKRGALAWTLIIESGHIPLRTRLGDLQPRHVSTFAMEALYLDTKGSFSKDLHNVWTLILGKTGN